MATFADSAGRVWEVTFTVSGIKRVRDMVNVNLAELHGNEFKNYVEVAGDPVKLAEVIFALAGKQHPGVTLDEFMDALTGDTLYAAVEAFEKAFISFCPSRQRELLTKLAAKTADLQAEAIRTATAQVDGVTFSPSATGSPASSGLTPAA